MVPTEKPEVAAGPLGDTATRDYARKLRQFNAFAAPELRRAIAGLQLRVGQAVFDAGCGTGEALSWLAEAVGPQGLVVGADLSAVHLRSALQTAPPQALLLQGDLGSLALAESRFDLVWCVNTLHHLREPLGGLRRLARLLRSGGRVALGQSSLLPDMVFAWDARLESRVNEAVRRYYRERYGLDERELSAVRALAGTLRQAGLADVEVRTVAIERLAPLGTADVDYLLQAIFRATWGERLRPYLDADDYAELARLCDPADAGFALRRPDFHFLQTFTLAVGRRAD